MISTKPTMEMTAYIAFHCKGPSLVIMEARQPFAKMRVEWTPRKRTSPRISKAIAAPPESQGAAIMYCRVEFAGLEGAAVNWPDNASGIRPTSTHQSAAHTLP